MSEEPGEVYAQVFTIEEAAAWLRMGEVKFRELVYKTKKIKPVFTLAELKRFNSNSQRVATKRPMSARVEKLEAEVRDLRKRIETLESKANGND